MILENAQAYGLLLGFSLLVAVVFMIVNIKAGAQWLKVISLVGLLGMLGLACLVVVKFAMEVL